MYIAITHPALRSSHALSSSVPISTLYLTSSLSFSISLYLSFSFSFLFYSSIFTYRFNFLSFFDSSPFLSFVLFLPLLFFYVVFKLKSNKSRVAQAKCLPVKLAEDDSFPNSSFQANGMCLIENDIPTLLPAAKILRPSVLVS